MDNMQDAIREEGLEIFRQMDAGPPEIFDTVRAGDLPRTCCRDMVSIVFL